MSAAIPLPTASTPAANAGAANTSRLRTPARLLPAALARTQWLPDSLSKRIFGAPLAPTAEEWQCVEAALWQGDAAMDAVVDWMFADRPGQRKALFDQALKNGIESLENPPEALTTFFAHVDTPPPWLDRDLLEQGARDSRLSGQVGFYVLRDMALMGGYALFNSMNQTLAGSGALRKETGLRLGETAKWTIDVTEPQGMDRFGVGFITTIRVRMVHALVRRHLHQKPDWEAEKWGLPINQIDMLATYLAFGPVSILGARLMGVPYSAKDARGLMHLWRYIGWLMGVDEQWLAKTEGDGLRKLYHTFLTHRLPDEKVRLLGVSLRDEPLTRHFPEHQAQPLRLRWKRWFAYQKHISNSSLILGPVQRWRLGIPMLALPWYPAISAPVRLIFLGFLKWRGGDALETYLQKSRQQQKALMAAYFEGGEQDIIKPKEDHPAHL